MNLPEMPMPFHPAPAWLDATLRSLLDALARSSATLAQAPAAWITVTEDSRSWLAGCHGAAPESLPAHPPSAPGNGQGPFERLEDVSDGTGMGMHFPFRLTNTSLHGTLYVIGQNASPLPSSTREALRHQADLAARIMEQAMLANDTLSRQQQRTDRNAIAREVVDSLPAMVAYWDADLRNHYASPAYARWLGKTPDEIHGRHFAEVLGPELFQRNVVNIQTVLAGEEVAFEREIGTPDCHYSQYSLVRFVPSRGADGSVKGFIVSATDISAHRDMELKLIEQEQRYRSFFHNAPVKMQLTDAQGKIQLVNAAWLTKMGYGAQEVIGRSTREFMTAAPLAPAKRSVLPASLWADNRQEAEYRMVTRSGVSMDTQVSSVEVQGFGDTTLTLTCIQDITAQKALEKQLCEAKNRAEAADHAKTQFLAVVSHELRTPLHTILGYTRLLRKKLSGEAASKLGIIEYNGLQLSRLIEDVLYYSRGDQLPRNTSLQTIHLGSMAASLHGSSKLLAQRNGNRFTLELEPGLPELVETNERYLLQILNNLISNACKFTQRGKVQVRIGREPTPPEADGRCWLRFSVGDTGPGIAPEDRERIFEPFGRSAAHQNTPGVGLGLTIVRQLVQSLGGRIRLDSRPGEGSRFHVSLPVSPAPEAAPHDTLDASNRIVGHTAPRRTLLIVDDSRDGRLYLTELCRQWGFRVQQASDGDAAWQVCQLPAGKNIDLIITDQCMPRSSGWQLLQKLRRSEAHAHTPVFMISAGAVEPPAAMAGERLGCDAVLLKPVDQNRLARQLQRHLRLEWLTSKQEEADEADEAPMPHRPPPEDMDEFKAFLELGQLVALRRWAERLRESRPDYAPFAEQVIRQCREIRLEELKDWLAPVVQESQ